MTSKLDPKKIAELLGAEYVERVPARSGYFGALETLANCRVIDQERKCLIEAFFAKEAEKPGHLRKNYCHIYCPCCKCNPRIM